MTTDSTTPKLRWGFSASMLFIYLAVFHVWIPFPRFATALLGVITAFGLAIGTFEWSRRNYFVNRFDHFGHLVVALDVLLEGLLVPVHSGYGFYWCAAGFAAVIGGYRLYAFRKKNSCGALGSEKESRPRESPSDAGVSVFPEKPEKSID